MEKTLELVPPSALFRALLGACEVPGDALQKPLPGKVPHSPHSTLRAHLLKDTAHPHGPQQTDQAPQEGWQRSRAFPCFFVPARSQQSGYPAGLPAASPTGP